MAELSDIEQAAERYRRSLDHLLDEASKLDRKLRRTKAQHAPILRRAANQAAQDGAELERLVAENPELFERPRTRTLHGVKVGYQAAKANLQIPDEAHSIARLRELLPGKAPEHIKVTEKLEKRSLWDLGRSMLERLGVRIVEGSETVIVKPAESDALKMSQELLLSAEHAADEAADGQSGEAA